MFKEWLKDTSELFKSGSGLKFYVITFFTVFLFIVISNLTLATIWTWYFLRIIIATLYIELIFLLIKPTRHPWGLLLAVLTILVVSSFWSITDKNWEHFQRSGSLLVVLSLIAYGSNYRENLAANSRAMIVSIKEFYDFILDEDSSTIWLHERVPRKLSNYIIEWKNLDMEQTIKIGRVWELTLLIVGTFIWGYGDFVGKIF